MGVLAAESASAVASPSSGARRSFGTPNTIVDIHRRSRRSCGSPRVHADLRLGEGIRCSRKRVERLMRQARIAGIYRRKGHGCTRRDPAATPAEDLVKRHFTVEGPDRLWVMDVTEHRTDEGKVYLGVVVDAWSRRVVGWSIADHMRSELVVDAVQMAIWRRRPPTGQCIAHSDHGSQPGLGVRHPPPGRRPPRIDGEHRRRYDNSMAESFFSTCSSNSSTSTTGPAAASSRPGDLRMDRVLVTTRPAGTPLSRCSALSTTKPATPPPQLRHDHHNQPVRRTGGSSLRARADRHGKRSFARTW